MFSSWWYRFLYHDSLPIAPRMAGGLFGRYCSMLRVKSPLDRLCERCGVLPAYRDIWGEVHSTSDATKRALLAAMGIVADSDEAIARSLLVLVPGQRPPSAGGVRRSRRSPARR